MNNTNNYSARESYRIAKGVFFKAMRNQFPSDEACQQYVDQLKLSQSEVRLEVQLAANTNIFRFGVIVTQANNQGIVFNTEQRLNMQDTLCVNEYGLFVAKPASQTDTAFKLLTYGNTQTFTAGAAAAIDSTLYANGALVTKVNGDVVIPYRGLYNHFYVPETQQTAALGANSPKDQIRLAEDGFITQEPNFLLVGSKNYIPQVELKSNLATVDEFSRLVLIYRGVLAQNSTVVN